MLGIEQQVQDDPEGFLVVQNGFILLKLIPITLLVGDPGRRPRGPNSLHHTGGQYPFI